MSKSTKDAIKLALIILAVTAVVRLVVPRIPVVGGPLAGAVA